VGSDPLAHGVTECPCGAGSQSPCPWGDMVSLWGQSPCRDVVSLWGQSPYPWGDVVSLWGQSHRPVG